ncbi:MAG: hypothetical protein JSS81_25875 [Acidobacteria bacterium]|nr:hypothetical protein [Acidobacteriota bacterium]
MKKFLHGILFLIFIIISAQAQSNKISLVVASYPPEEKLGTTRQVYRYDFEAGEYRGRTLIASSTEIRLGSGERIYRNRYLVSRNGDVIDLVDKKILNLGDGRLSRIDGDRIFIEVNKDRKNGLYVYDLGTKRYGLFRKTGLQWGMLSPNGLRSVNANGSSLSIYENGRFRKSLGGGFDLNVEANEMSSEMLRVAAFWLDDRRILTQKGNGNLVIVDVDGKTTRALKIPDVGACGGNPQIYRDNRERLIYRCDDTFEIDLQKKTYRKLAAELGYGFTYKSGDTASTEYFYDRRSIGRVWSVSAVAADGYLAMLFAAEGKNLGYPDGVRVWNKYRNEWTTIEIAWGAEIIGWLN